MTDRKIRVDGYGRGKGAVCHSETGQRGIWNQSGRYAFASR